MFRRKEEGLFDTMNPAEENQEATTSETTQAASQPAAAPASAPTVASGFAAQPVRQATPLTTGEARPASAPTANQFRPSASSMTSDLTRNRLPEAKSNAVSNLQASISAQTTVVSSVPTPASNKSGRRVLTVGNDILLKGEIATCDRLVIEGKVDATLNDVHTVEIAEGGSFKGSAQIEDAEISGLFEGDLTVRGRLVIYATGKVRGKISYGEIEIERGGELTGEIKITGASAATTTRTREKVAA